MRIGLVTALMLAGVASATAQDYYDAAYVSDRAVCDRAGEKPVAELLFETNSWLVLPRSRILAGEMACQLHDVQQIDSTYMGTPELLAVARCHGFEIDFLDQIVVEADSFGINQSFGDDGIEHKVGEKVEIVSMRADTKPEDYENYAGLYWRCDALTEEAGRWPE